MSDAAPQVDSNNLGAEQEMVSPIISVDVEEIVTYKVEKKSSSEHRFYEAFVSFSIIDETVEIMPAEEPISLYGAEEKDLQGFDQSSVEPGESVETEFKMSNILLLRLQEGQSLIEVPTIPTDESATIEQIIITRLQKVKLGRVLLGLTLIDLSASEQENAIENPLNDTLTYTELAMDTVGLSVPLSLPQTEGKIEELPAIGTTAETIQKEEDTIGVKAKIVEMIQDELIEKENTGESQKPAIIYIIKIMKIRQLLAELDSEETQLNINKNCTDIAPPEEVVTETGAIPLIITLKLEGNGRFNRGIQLNSAHDIQSKWLNGIVKRTNEFRPLQSLINSFLSSYTLLAEDKRKSNYFTPTNLEDKHELDYVSSDQTINSRLDLLISKLNLLGTKEFKSIVISGKILIQIIADLKSYISSYSRIGRCALLLTLSF